MEAIFIIAILLNNIAWMFFFFIFTPQEKKRPVKMPRLRPKANPEEKKDPLIPDVMEDIMGIGLESAAKSVGIDTSRMGK